jgi:ADP-heptose:LPS heptosyltransferase
VPTLGATNPLFGFFAHATALKTLDRRYWVEFWDAFLALEPQARPIEFLPGPHTAPTVPRFASLHIRSPRALAATIAATRLFISADTGPMHLASATTVPTVALFCATDPALYGPMKPSDLALEVAQYPPQLAARRCQLLWREGAARAPGIRERA